MVDGVDVVLDSLGVPEGEAGQELLLYGGVEAAEDDRLVSEGGDGLHVLTSSWATNIFYLKFLKYFQHYMYVVSVLFFKQLNENQIP